MYNQHNNKKQHLTKQAALKKIQHYCTYQERCHKEVKDKLYLLGLFKNEVEELISSLIEENYLNEERYAKMFAGGHFRMKKWGRVKISTELKYKNVSPYNINIAMKEIDESQYLSVLETLAKKKWDSLKTDQYLIRQTKTKNYLIQKGYELNLVNNIVSSFIKNKK